jgi:hypothetical protein
MEIAEVEFGDSTGDKDKLGTTQYRGESCLLGRTMQSVD